MTRDELIRNGYISVGFKGTFECLAKKDPFDNSTVHFCMVDKQGNQIGRAEQLESSDIEMKYRAIKMLGIDSE